jgi:4-hydroxy-tetrahydrodipicolinate synthase
MKNFKGTFTALITPFKNGSIDFPSLDKMMKHQLENGVDGFVINGTTAESPTLTNSEKEELFKHARQFCGDQVPLIMGTGSNSTAHFARKIFQIINICIIMDFLDCVRNTRI